MVISASYPTGARFDSDDIRHVWYRMLKPYRSEDVLARLTEHIRTNRFPPAIADLVPKADAEEQTLDEWRRITALVGRYGYYRQREALDAMSEEQREAVRAIGYARLCRSEPNALYNEFTAVYKPMTAEVMII